MIRFSIKCRSSRLMIQLPPSSNKANFWFSILPKMAQNKHDSLPSEITLANETTPHKLRFSACLVQIQFIPAIAHLKFENYTFTYFFFGLFKYSKVHCSNGYIGRLKFSSNRLQLLTATCLRMMKKLILKISAI